MIAIDPNRKHDYVLECERGQPHPTVWKIVPLTVGEQAEVEDLTRLVGAEFVTRSGQARYLHLRYGLAGASNWLDESGVTVPFVRVERRTDDATLSRIPAWARDELATAILQLGLQDADRKNWSSPQDSSPEPSSRTAGAAAQ